MNADAIARFKTLGFETCNKFPDNCASAPRCYKTGRVAGIYKDLKDIRHLKYRGSIGRALTGLCGLLSTSSNVKESKSVGAGSYFMIMIAIPGRRGSDVS